MPQLSADTLGSAAFRARHGLRYAYVAGAMYRGVASPALVVRMGRAGCMGYLGTGGMPLDWIETALAEIARGLAQGQPWGANLLANYDEPAMEDRTVDLFLRAGVRRVEAAAFVQMTPALVRWRLAGLSRGPDGRARCAHHVLAKVSRPEVAEAFLRPAPQGVVARLLAEGRVTPLQAELAREVPMAHEICVEADSGGHTDGGVAIVLMPAMLRLRERICAELRYAEPVCMGLAGGIGAPEAAAAAFVMGADFILTGSINQCTVEAGMSEDVKDMLQQMNVQDTAHAPAGDMFETGARVQVLRRGVFFPVRANRLHALYTQYDGLDEIPEKTAREVQHSYFKRSFAQVWAETQEWLRAQGREALIAKAEANPKQKMALVFRWYFGHSTQAAFAGRREDRVNYQVQTGPALGAFNQWVKGTPLEPWRARHADEIGVKLMSDTARLLGERFGALLAAGAAGSNTT